MATHPGRFWPLQSIADALVSHVVNTYDVAVLEDVDVAKDPFREPSDVLRAVRTIPCRELASPLTKVITSHPGVEVHAGELSDESFPSCDCDACDESLEMVEERFEEFVFAVVEGRFWERIGRGKILGWKAGQVKDGAGPRRPAFLRNGCEKPAKSSQRYAMAGLPGPRNISAAQRADRCPRLT